MIRVASSVLLILSCLLSAGAAADGGAGGAGGAGGGGGGGGGAGGSGSVLPVPVLSPAQAQEVLKTLSAGQQHLLDLAIQAQVADDKTMTVAQARSMLLGYLAMVGPGGYHAVFHQLGLALHAPLPDDDPDDLSPEDKRRAAGVAAQVAQPLADLEHGDAVLAEQAWRQLLAVGPDARAAVLLRVRQLPPGSIAAIRMRCVAEDLKSAPEKLHVFQALDGVHAAIAGLPRAQREQACWVISRRLDDAAGGQHLCYWSFPLHRRGYDEPVSLEYGNGRPRCSLSVLMYGGQDNQIIDLGTRQRLPSTWDEALRTSGAIAGSQEVGAVVGHTYAERLHERSADTWVLFTVLACCEDWCVFAPRAVATR